MIIINAFFSSSDDISGSKIGLMLEFCWWQVDAHDVFDLICFKKIKKNIDNFFMYI